MVNVEVNKYKSGWSNLPEEVWNSVRERIPQLYLSAWEKKEEWWRSETLMGLDDLRFLGEMELQVELKPLKENLMIVKLVDRISDLEARTSGDIDDVLKLKEGAMVQIHIPDHTLSYVDEVDHLDDCCTDTLQEKLDEGWRILAVCPPNAQRRPDYVIGRRKRTIR